MSYHIVREELQNEGSDGCSDSEKHIDNDHENISWAGFTEEKRPRVHNRSDGPSTERQQEQQNLESVEIDIKPCKKVTSKQATFELSLPN